MPPARSRREPPLVQVARRFHELREELAPRVGHVTWAGSAVPWDEVPEADRKLMVMTVNRLVGEGTIGLPTASAPDGSVR